MGSHYVCFWYIDLVKFWFKRTMFTIPQIDSVFHSKSSFSYLLWNMELWLVVYINCYIMPLYFTKAHKHVFRYVDIFFWWETQFSWHYVGRQGRVALPATLFEQKRRRQINLYSVISVNPPDSVHHESRRKYWINIVQHTKSCSLSNRWYHIFFLVVSVIPWLFLSWEQKTILGKHNYAYKVLSALR